MYMYVDDVNVSAHLCSTVQFYANDHMLVAFCKQDRGRGWNEDDGNGGKGMTEGGCTYYMSFLSLSLSCMSQFTFKIHTYTGTNRD